VFEEPTMNLDVMIDDAFSEWYREMSGGYPHALDLNAPVKLVSVRFVGEWHGEFSGQNKEGIIPLRFLAPVDASIEYIPSNE